MTPQARVIPGERVRPGGATHSRLERLRALTAVIEEKRAVGVSGSACEASMQVSDWKSGAYRVAVCALCGPVAVWRLFDLEGEARHDLVRIAAWG